MMAQHPPAWYDAQYDNRARIAEHPAILAHRADASARALATLVLHELADPVADRLFRRRAGSPR